MKNLIKAAALLIASAGLISVSNVALAGHTNALLSANLNGKQEVGTKGDRNGSGHSYVFGIDGDALTLCYTLTVKRVQLVPVPDMMAHIHEGRRGQNGPVVAVLAGPEDGNAADCLTEGETGKFPTGESGIVQRILENPRDFYVNVHNPRHPSGAIRGQLNYQSAKRRKHKH